MTQFPFPPWPVRAWADASDAELRSVQGVLTDIDDTLTEHGVIAPAALHALADLRTRGLPVMAITGRPCGWSEAFARDWPVDAIVAENGAVALFKSGNDLLTEFAQDDATRQCNAQRLQATAERVLREVPGSRCSQDSPGRLTDIAIDHAEHAHLDAAQIEAVVRVMSAAGMRVTVSSIHINGWFGEHDKLSGAHWIVRRLLGRDLHAERAHWIYVGDSTNDERMFEAFPLSVGVANLLDFSPALKVWPRYLTAAARGAGFAQVAQRLCALRPVPTGHPTDV